VAVSGKSVAPLLVLSILLASCSDGTSPASGECLNPPSTEQERTSDLELTVTPNPVAAGSLATISVSLGGPSSYYVGGAGAAWQCWDGSGWVTTHQIVRGFSGNPITLEVAPGATTTIPAIGLRIPNSYPIVIPDVSPGIYRITDAAYRRSVEATGFVLVEVR
jgi:hypothetical protein